MEATMNNLIKLFCFLLFLGIVVSSLSYAGDHSIEIAELKKGKNLIQINATIFAKDLVYLNKDIEYILYFDETLNKNVVYVNAFNGLGSNYLIIPDRVYEISVKKDIKLRV
jgi:hypothetical protein